MILLLFDDFSKNFAERELAHGVGLANPLPIVDNSLPFVFQVKPEHLFGLPRHLDFLWGARRRAIEIIDLSGNQDCMAKLFRSVSFKFRCNIVKGGAFDRLAVNGVGDIAWYSRERSSLRRWTIRSLL